MSAIFTPCTIRKAVELWPFGQSVVELLSNARVDLLLTVNDLHGDIGCQVDFIRYRSHKVVISGILKG
jgi:hypothetical protein